MLLKIPIKGIEKKFDVKILSVHFAFLERVRHKIEEKREKKREKDKEKRMVCQDPLST
jgi:hypothetical protein